MDYNMNFTDFHFPFYPLPEFAEFLYSSAREYKMVSLGLPSSQDQDHVIQLGSNLPTFFDRFWNGVWPKVHLSTVICKTSETFYFAFLLLMSVKCILVLCLTSYQSLPKCITEWCIIYQKPPPPFFFNPKPTELLDDFLPYLSEIWSDFHSVKKPLEAGNVHSLIGAPPLGLASAPGALIMEFTVFSQHSLFCNGRMVLLKLLPRQLNVLSTFLWSGFPSLQWPLLLMNTLVIA